MSAWQWRSKDGAQGALLYEPGNWGDLLKAVWIVRVAEWLLKRGGVAGFGYLDPFAGAPAYPLSARAQARLERVGDEQLAAVCEPFLEAGEWPSAARFVAAVAAGVPAARLHAFDKDADRRQGLAACGCFTLPAAACGWEILEAGIPPGTTLILVDPYDLLADWGAHLAAILRATATASVLLYVYNRSARGKEHLRTYRDFRNALDDAWGERPRRLARVPADGFLPTAHHGLVFLPAADLVAEAQLSSLLLDLEASALRLDRAVREGGVVGR